MLFSTIFAGAALATTAAAECSRAFLTAATDAYVMAQGMGHASFAPLADNVTYSENEMAMDIKKGLLAEALRIDHNRSVHDTVQCRTFTELIVTDPKHPYVIGTRMIFTGAGSAAEITMIESIVTDKGDWAFNATGTFYWNSLESWEPIPEAKRESRAVIQAAGDAYFDRFDRTDVVVPWGTPCARLEGGAYTGARDRTIDSCSPAGMPSGIKVTNRRYVVDEVMGVVDIFLGFPGLDRSIGQTPAPDSHMFRVEGGKIRYIHTVSYCVKAGCGMNGTIPMRARRH